MAQNDAGNAGALPVGWVRTTIGEVTQPIKKVKPGKNPGTRFTYLDISSIDNGLNRVTEPKSYLGSEAPSRARQLVYANDVLFSTVRTYLRNIALVPEPYDGQIASTGFSVLRGEPGISPKYLFYYSLTDGFLNELGKLQRGTSYPAVRDGDVREQPIPLAPFPEQHRIVAEIETQFTRLEAGVAALKRAQANLRRYRAAVLKAACEGRLVPTEAELARTEGRDYEPADVLLQRILAECRAKWEADNPGKRYQAPIPPDTSDLPELPEGWVWASLDELTYHITSGSRGWAKYYSDTGSVFIRAQDINTDELVLDNVACVELSESTEGVRTRVFQDDLLVTITGANVTKTALVKQQPDEAYVSQHVGLVRPVLTDTSLYLYYWIVSPAHGRGMLEKDAYGAGKPGLNLTNLRELVVALPCLSEQHRIVAEVERRLSVVTELEKQVEAALRRAERLRQAILKRAFEGRLVPQDPADEPASALWARIQVARKQDGNHIQKPAPAQLHLPAM
ncbi:MAG: restriction endonuclease subunit S [Anaerolineae bacterium]|nr:restriction endonuclease subunit S [Anaerolineae bacterium]